MQKIRTVKETNQRMRDTLEDERSSITKTDTETSDNHSTRLIRRKAEDGRHGGVRRWPIWIVQLICELLVDGAPPSSIPGIIQTTYSTYNQKPPTNLPLVNFVRQYRVIIQIIGETLAAIKLARVEKWSQLFTDGTTRRQISFQNLIIGFMKDDNQLDPVVVSSCIFLEDETSEKQTDGILKKLNLLKKRLRRLREVVEEMFPDKIHMIPSDNNIDISKMGY